MGKLIGAQLSLTILECHRQELSRQSMQRIEDSCAAITYYTVQICPKRVTKFRSTCIVPYTS